MAKTPLEDIFEDLQQQRDELRVQMALAKAEAKEEWEAMEAKWAEVEAKVKGAGKEASESSKDVVAALGLVAEELGKAYDRIRTKL
jgi:hypothetical protein